MRETGFLTETVTKYFTLISALLHKLLIVFVQEKFVSARIFSTEITTF